MELAERLETILRQVRQPPEAERGSTSPCHGRTGRPHWRFGVSLVLGGPASTACRALMELRRAGVRLVIDDFGTGYSSLAYLKRLPVGELKIGRLFVSEVGNGGVDLAIVRSVTALAHALDLRVTAEGVEDDDGLSRLRLLGCDELRGYHFGRPMPAAAILEWAPYMARPAAAAAA